ncbi:multidrug transporter [Microbacterium sp. BR1]|uniref:multidrug transporter n=1 Tax=Microbacterium sp. BR1 TaxID=1070896 RepID=UPI001E375F41|nr:multidrug transporter [Microbacterium sp. BR1]
MDDQARDDKTMNDKNDTGDVDMTAEEKRRDQLLAAPDAVESDAAPRIEVSKHDGNTRIDIADDAPVRPGPAPEGD